jgi:hypothetical protein
MKPAKLGAVPINFSDIRSLYQSFEPQLPELTQPCRIHPRSISPNALTSRFSLVKDEDGNFAFIPLEIHQNILDQVTPLTKAEFGQYYFEGPQGIGKSFTLLYIVLTLRRQKDLYRVIYINNPELWKKYKIQYIANELIWAFMEDQKTFPCPSGENSENPLEEWYTLLSAENPKESDFELFLRTADKHCKNQNLWLVSFMDQENSVTDMLNLPQNTYSFPFNFYSRMPAVPTSFTFASANNYTSVKRTQGWENLADHLKLSFKSFLFPSIY